MPIPSQNNMLSKVGNISESSIGMSRTPSKQSAADRGSSVSNESKCCCWSVGIGARAPVLGSGCVLSLLLDSTLLLPAVQQRESKIKPTE